MSSTDVLQKIRQNYESLIATSSKDHKRQLEDLEQSVATLEKELQEMVCHYVTTYHPMLHSYHMQLRYFFSVLCVSCGGCVHYYYRKQRMIA